MSNCVYKITNIINGKAYVGSTNNYTRRMKEHRVFANCSPDRPGYNRHLYCSFRKYGLENFRFEILIDNIETLSQARQLEYQKKKELNTMEPNGYNIFDGTEGCTEKDIERMKQQQGTKCALVTPDEEIIEIYPSLREAARKNNVVDNGEQIGKVCKGESYSCQGKIFRFLDEINNIVEIDFEKKKNLKYVPICGINPINLDKIYFDSIEQAANFVSVTPNLISKCIAGESRYSVVKGYIWRKFIYNTIIENNLPIQDVIDQYNKKYILYKGERNTLNNWCKILNLPYDAMRYQIKYKHKTFEEALLLFNNK